MLPELTVVGWIKILFHPLNLELSSSSSSSSALSCLYQFDNSTLKSPRTFFKYGILFAILSKFSSKLSANVHRNHANEWAKDMKKQNYISQSEQCVKSVLKTPYLSVFSPKKENTDQNTDTFDAVQILFQNLSSFQVVNI